MHIATQNVKNQPETIKILVQAMPWSFEAMDDNRMTALHYACQRTTDVALVRTVLSYKKDNINVITKDRLTALDLISQRTQVTTQSKGMFAIEPKQQEEIVQLIRNNGGKSGTEPPGDQVPGQVVGSRDGQMEFPAQNFGYPAHCSGSMPSSSPSYSMSPVPHGLHILLPQLQHYKPQDPTLGSPVSIPNPSMNSVRSYQQASPEFKYIGSPHYQSSPQYQVKSCNL